MTLLATQSGREDLSGQYQNALLKDVIPFWLRHGIDHEQGGWYEGGLDRDPANRLRPKAHIWKAAYHDTRALMNVVRRLEGG